MQATLASSRSKDWVGPRRTTGFQGWRVQSTPFQEAAVPMSCPGASTAAPEYHIWKKGAPKISTCSTSKVPSEPASQAPVARWLAAITGLQSTCSHPSPTASKPQSSRACGSGRPATSRA